MFKKLDNFSYKRTGLEAFGFFLAFGFLGMIIGAVSNLILAIVLQVPMETFQDGIESVKVTGKYIFLISGVYASVINVIVAKAKNRTNQIGAIFSVLLSFLLSFFFGCFIGLIPSAVMTTKDVLDE